MYRAADCCGGLAMKAALQEAAKSLARGRDRAFVSRVAWLDLDRLVTAAYETISTCSREATELGDLYLTRNREYPPFNKPHFSSVNIINQIQIQTGWRLLNVSRVISENDAPRSEVLAESGATLWFSQDATGAVTVFLAPYKSKAMRVDEANIILARHGCASEVSERCVNQYFVAYFRYCAATSAHGHRGWKGYGYRLWLIYNDFRYSTKRRAVLVRGLELLLAAGGVIATLYTGNKLFN